MVNFIGSETLPRPNFASDGARHVPCLHRLCRPLRTLDPPPVAVCAERIYALTPALEKEALAHALGGALAHKRGPYPSSG